MALLENIDYTPGQDTVEDVYNKVNAAIDAVNAALLGTNTRIKLLDIGDWNMDSAGTVNVAHGLTLSKIRSVSVVIRNDAGTATYNLDGVHNDYTVIDGYFNWGTTNVTMDRKPGEFFDSTDFDSTGYNRGWISIIYTE